MFNRSTFFACTSCKSLILNQDNEENNHKKKSPARKTDKAATTTPEAIELEEVCDVTDDNLGDTEPTGDILEKIEVFTDNIEDTQSPKVACKYYQKNLCKFGII